MSAEQWQGLVEEQAASGVRKAAFCASRGIAKSTFQLLKRRLKGESSISQYRSSLGAMFAPLSVAVAEPPRGAEGECGWEIELDLGDGVCLRFRRGGACR